MKEKVHRFLLSGDLFMPEMHLREPGITYSAYGSFTNTEAIEKFKERGRLKDIYQTKQIKAAVTTRATFDKVLGDKAFNLVKNLKRNGYQRGIVSLVYNCFTKSLIRRQFH